MEWWQLVGGAVVGVVTAALGGGVVVAKLLDRPVIKANARSTEVDTILKVVQDVRAADAAKSERIEQLERRIDLLEERERHALTRAAVHEAWDQMAFGALVRQNPQHPPPPPLRGPLGPGTPDQTP